jgi:hypothetical protein
MRTELVTEMPMAEYRAQAGLSKHQLDAFFTCPQYYRWKLTQEWKPSREMELGTCIHSLALEGRKDYAIAPECDRRTKIGKETWEAFCLENPGKIIVNQEEGARIEGACLAVEPLLASITKARTIEASMFWERRGHQCKGRPDMITEIDGQLALVDLKTTTDIMRFDSKFFSFGYDVQAHWYAYGLAEVFTENVEHIAFHFLVVDTQAPYLCQWVDVAPEILFRAEKRVDEALDQLLHCQTQDVWPGLPFRRTIAPKTWA